MRGKKGHEVCLKIYGSRHVTMLEFPFVTWTCAQTNINQDGQKKLRLKIKRKNFLKKAKRNKVKEGNTRHTYVCGRHAQWPMLAADGVSSTTQLHNKQIRDDSHEGRQIVQSWRRAFSAM